MKKLFPLFIFGVATLFFSCEKHKPTIAEVEFAQALQTLTFEENLTVKVTMTRPAATDITIPFELSGDAVEGEDFIFTNVEDHYISIPQGQLEGELTLEHLLHNGQELSCRIKLRPGNGYVLGDNATCVVTIGEREKIYLSFDYAEYPTDEFNNVYIGVTLTGEKSGENFKAPDNIELGFKVIPKSDVSGVTNVPDEGWSWIGQTNNNNTITIEKGTNKGGRILRVKFADTSLPEPAVEPGEGDDDLPVGEEGEEEPVEPTVYKAAVTIRTQTAMANMGIEFGEIDTTYVIYNRLENPIEDLLMGKKWVNPTLGFNESFSNRDLFWTVMNTAGEDYELLPYRHKFTDSFVFGKEIGDDGEPYYTVTIDADPDSEFANFFRSDTVSFVNYVILNTVYMEGSGTGGFNLEMKVNKAFSPYPAEEEIIKAYVFFVPGSVSGEDNSYMDIFIRNGDYNKYPGRFFYNLNLYRDPMGSRPYGDRYCDIWYRVYEDKTPMP